MKFMVMTESQFDKLSEDMIDAAYAQDLLRKVAEEEKAKLKLLQCPCCGSSKTRGYKGIEGAFKCPQCSCFFGVGFKVTFPKWAQGKKAHFRRFICMTFGITGE